MVMSFVCIHDNDPTLDLCKINRYTQRERIIIALGQVIRTPPNQTAIALSVVKYSLLSILLLSCNWQVRHGIIP